MADLRIVDAPEIPTENITGEEKLPTGGSGNYSISLDSLADYTKTKKDLVDNTSVDTKVNGVRQELTTHIEDLLNPHQVTKGQIGLGNVDNTADADKPVSNSTQAAIISAVAPKADKTYVDSQLTLKANKVDVYTKAETYTKQESSDLVNSSISTALTPVNTALDLAKRGIANRYDPLLTYNSGERVVLTNDDIVKSTIDGNTNDPNTDLIGWVKDNSASQIFDESGKTQQDLNTLFKNQKLIDTRLYGLKVNTGEDQTAAIHAAFAANPDNQYFYIPKGIVKANIVFPRAYMYLVGDGLLNTIIEPFDLTKSVINFNKKLYSGLLDITAQAPQEHTAASVIDATDVRYMHLENVDVRKTITSGQAHAYQGILIDNRPIAGSWTGYNKLRNVRGVFGGYGYLSDIDKLNSVLLMDGCLFSFNGYFNIKTSASNSTFINMDVANGGKLQPVDTYDETQYGGMYIKGDNSVVLGVWHELNAQSSPSYNSNNLYIDPTGGGNITHNFARDTRGTNNVRVYTQSQGQLQDVNTADRSLNDGQGRARPQQLIKNGNFSHWDSSLNRPRGWSGYFSGTWTQETVDLPKGYDTGLKVVSNVAGVCGIYQAIYNPANLTDSYIKDISKWIGREITVSFWVKNIGTSQTAIRGGISIDLSNVFFSSGTYISTTKVGEFTKVVLAIKVTGTEQRIWAGVRVSGIDEGMIVAGFSVADDCRVNDAQPKSITEGGGEIFGNLEVRGTFTNNGVSPLFQPTVVTTTGLTNATGSINTVGKYLGKQVFNNTNSLMYYATGTTPTSAWKSFDSTNTITPA